MNSEIQATLVTREQISDPKNIGAFVGPNSAFYLRAWLPLNEDATLSRRNKRLGMNIWAFLLTPFWFAYRKLYLWAFLWCLLAAAASVFDQHYKLLTNLVLIVVGVALSTFANRIYFNRYLDKLSQTIAVDENEEIRRVTLRNAGGVSWLAVLLFALPLVLLAAFSSEIINMPALRESLKESYPKDRQEESVTKPGIFKIMLADIPKCDSTEAKDSLEKVFAEQADNSKSIKLLDLAHQKEIYASEAAPLEIDSKDTAPLRACVAKFTTNQGSEIAFYRFYANSDGTDIMIEIQAMIGGVFPPDLFNYYVKLSGKESKTPDNAALPVQQLAPVSSDAVLDEPKATTLPEQPIPLRPVPDRKTPTALQNVIDEQDWSSVRQALVFAGSINDPENYVSWNNAETGHEGKVVLTTQPSRDDCHNFRVTRKTTDDMMIGLVEVCN